MTIKSLAHRTPIFVSLQTTQRLLPQEVADRQHRERQDREHADFQQFQADNREKADFSVALTRVNHYRRRRQCSSDLT